MEEEEYLILEGRTATSVTCKIATPAVDDRFGGKSYVNNLPDLAEEELIEGFESAWTQRINDTRSILQTLRTF